jgi:hypothetical protein
MTYMYAMLLAVMLVGAGCAAGVRVRIPGEVKIQADVYTNCYEHRHWSGKKHVHCE